MSGPTVITEVLQQAAAIANRAQQEARRVGKQKYSTLLLVTNGAVSDVAATERCIKSISDAPLSVIIVGVGSADFSAMQFLDDIANRLEIPEIVKFVHVNALPDPILKELQEHQLVEYFQRNGIHPNSSCS